MGVHRLTIDPIVEFPRASSTQKNNIDSPLDLTPLTERVLRPGNIIEEVPIARGLALVEHSYPPPELASTFAASPDAEAPPRIQRAYQNRRIPMKLRAFDPYEPAADNLITNPSFELSNNMGGSNNGGEALKWRWSTASGVVLARETEAAGGKPAYAGDSYLRVTSASGASGGIETWESDTAGENLMQVNPNTAYTFSVALRWNGIGSAPLIHLDIQQFNSADGYVGVSTATAVRLTTEWVRYSVTYSFGALGEQANARIRQINEGFQSVWYVDAAQFEVGRATSYFDGDTPGCRWNSTPHGGPSTRLAPKDRFTGLLRDLSAKVAKIDRSGGVLRRVLPSGHEICFDLIEAKMTPDTPDAFRQGGSDVELEFVAKPYGRGAEIVRPVNYDTALPLALFVEDPLPGDVAGLGRMAVKNRGGGDAQYLGWGIQYDTYDAATTADLLYSAATMNVVSSSTPALTGGAYATSVLSPVLGTEWISVVQTAFGGADLTHWGDYEVFARVACKKKVALRFEWAYGDLLDKRYNDEVRTDRVIGSNGSPASHEWQFVSLGRISIPKVPDTLPQVAAQPQQWRGKIFARADDATGYQVAVDYIWLVPQELHGEAIQTVREQNMPSPLIIDDFNQAGNPQLFGQAPTAGGSLWVSVVGANTTTMFVDSTNKVAFRTATSDPQGANGEPLGGYMQLVGADQAESWAQMRFRRSAVGGGAVHQGVILRGYANDWARNLVCAVRHPPSSELLGVTRLRVLFGGVVLAEEELEPIEPNLWSSMRAVVTLNGRLFMWFWPTGREMPIIPQLECSLLYHAAGFPASPGPAIPSGRTGIFDHYPGVTAVRREYDFYRSGTYLADTVAYVNRYAEVNHREAIRHNSAGSNYRPMMHYTGDQMFLPPGGRQRRPIRTIAKLSRAVPGRGLDFSGKVADPSFDVAEVNFYHQPRYLVLPEGH